jgi:hypothetical protein
MKGIIMAKTLTPKEIASEWDVSAKTLRKFLRKDEKAISAQGGETPGKGGRWAIPATQLNSLKRRFDAWVEANAKKPEDAPESDEGAETVEVTETVIPDGTPLSALMNALGEMPEESVNED